MKTALQSAIARDMEGFFNAIQDLFESAGINTAERLELLASQGKLVSDSNFSSLMNILKLTQ